LKIGKIRQHFPFFVGFSILYIVFPVIYIFLVISPCHFSFATESLVKTPATLDCISLFYSVQAVEGGQLRAVMAKRSTRYTFSTLCAGK